MTVGAIQAHFNVAALKNLVLPLPPLAEQDHVIEIVATNEAPMVGLMEAATRQVKLLLEHAGR